MDELRQALYEMKKRRILDDHAHKIWQGADDKWRTYVHGEGGKRRLVKRTTRDGVEEAIVENEERLREKPPTLRDAIEQGVQDKEDRGFLKPQSRARADWTIKTIIKTGDPLLDRPMKSITEEDLERFIQRIIKDNGLTRQAWDKDKVVLRCGLMYAKRKKWTTISPTGFLGDLRLGKRIFLDPTEKKRIFTEVEAKKLRDYCEAHQENPYAILLYTMSETGLRVGEVVALKKEDLRLDSLYVHGTEIRYAKTGESVCRVQDFPKTETGQRTVYITPHLSALLQRHVRRYPETEWLFVGVRKKTGALLRKHAGT